MIIHLPPLFPLIGVLAATAFASWIVFGLFMLWGFSSDWGPRLALPATAVAAVVTAYFSFKLT
jgi:hypothetical protein